ncbi:hypothetical protein J6590_077882, partial [Homalodisca vitripennis]
RARTDIRPTPLGAMRVCVTRPKTGLCEISDLRATATSISEVNERPTSTSQKQWGLTHIYINKVVGDTTQRISQCSDAVFGYKGCGTVGLGCGEKLETIKAAGGDTSFRLDVFNIYFISLKESAFACLLLYETQYRQLKPVFT